MTNKLGLGMSIAESILALGEGNPGALRVAARILDSLEGFLDALMLDDLDIRGERLYKLDNDCCDRNLDKFNRTLEMFHSGVFTKAQIQENLQRPRAISFIDETIEMDIPPYGEAFSSDHPAWEDWCKAQSKSFEHRLAVVNSME